MPPSKQVYRVQAERIGERVMRCLAGDFRPTELRPYVTLLAVVFWGLIFISWRIFPKDHHYSIMTHTFSFLGSFEPKHNPDTWWVFSIAMAFWGTCFVPLTFYFRRRFALISPKGAWAGNALFLMGCLGIVLIAFFPDAHGKVIGNLEYTHIHMKAALLVALGFGVGIPLHIALLFRDWRTGQRAGVATPFTHRRYVWPSAIWIAVIGTGLYFQIGWDFRYPQLKAAAVAAGKDFGSPWTEAMNTRYSFPLWEHLAIYSIFLFLIWCAAALSLEEEKA